MHLPYIYKIFEGKNIQIVPILVGSISTSKEDAYGRLLAPYLKDRRNFFVVSSDFCLGVRALGTRTIVLQIRP